MTEKSILDRLNRWVDNRKFPFQLSNAFIYEWECDYWAMTAGGETREFEIKISRSDYFNDAKKAKHKSECGANYFYYVVPHGLIDKEEVDQKYGLIYIWDTGHVEIVKKPRQLNKNPFTLWKELASKMYWRYRALWKEKYLKEEIAFNEYVTGFNIELENGVLKDEPCPHQSIKE
jgi:hypothetical protein